MSRLTFDSSCAVIFQQFHIDYYVTVGQLKKSDEDAEVQPVICLFGRVDENRSICCHVHGFYPRIYASLKPALTQKQCSLIKNSLNDDIRKIPRQTTINVREAVLEVNIIPTSTRAFCQSSNKSQSYAEFIIAEPSLVATVKSVLDKDLKLDPTGTPNLKISALQDISDYVQMFRTEHKMTAFSWIEISPHKYTVRLEEGVSSCQLEIDVHVTDLNVHSPEGDWSKIIPLTILSFDIECECYEGRFVKPEVDAVIQISSVVQQYGETQPTKKAVFTVGTCAPIAAADVYIYSTENEMLSAWNEFVTRIDPDIITGFNIINFDIWYLIERLQNIGSDTPLNLSRIKNNKTTWGLTSYENRVDRRQKKFCILEGRVILDVMLRTCVECNLPRYSLGYVSAVFLDDKKENVAINMIMNLQKGDANSRKKLAEYCLKDSLLPLGIIGKNNLITKYIRTCLLHNMQLSDVLNNPHRNLLSTESTLGPYLLYRSSDNFTVQSVCNGDINYATCSRKVNDDESQSLKEFAPTTKTPPASLGMRRLGIPVKPNSKAADAADPTSNKYEMGHDNVSIKSVEQNTRVNEDVVETYRNCVPAKTRSRRFGLSRPSKLKK